MKNALCFLFAWALVLAVHAQSIPAKLAAAFAKFETDSQLKSAIASLYVVDATTGNILFEKNARIGLAPASTQKIITSATAYELLGKGFSYETKFGYYGSIKNGVLDGSLVIKPSGDPTLGSWRWPATTEDAVIKRVMAAFDSTGMKTVGSAVVDERGWEGKVIPGGWIWDDIGNYYGAGAAALNWRENQYDLVMKSGSHVGDPVTIVGTKPKLYGVALESRVTAAARGTGDNSYIYLPVAGAVGVVRGTIPVNEDRFTISGAMPSSANQFLFTLSDELREKGRTKGLENKIASQFSQGSLPAAVTYFHTEQSPPLDSIVYWFLKKSINLYGEALAKTMALQQKKTASSETGAEVIKTYWKDKGPGIDASELNLQDGSGLSPQNRVTTHAQVTVLQYAQAQPWFAGYYNAFPEYNGMKLKSGTIGGVKSFCGYHTSKDGKKYVLSFIVNNYNGASATLVQKMYQVLNVLK